MQRGRFYDDDELVRSTTMAIIQSGDSVLQVFQFGEDERQHVDYLVKLLAPPPGSLILDAGSGVGGVAKFMQCSRPDLDFILLNISRAQLDLSPPQFRRLHGSFECIPLPDSAVDVVMLNFALGHGRLDLAVFEARRVLKPKGVLFIFDMDGPPQDLPGVDYRIYGAGAIVALARSQGFCLDELPALPTASTQHMLKHVDTITLSQVFGSVTPMALRFHLKENGYAPR